MKKTLLLLFALFFWTGAWAQDVNHAHGVVPELVSGTTHEGALSNITDDDDGTSWQVNTGSGSSAVPVELIFDLESSKTIDMFRIVFTGNRHVKKFTLYKSDDKTNWTKIDDYNTGVTEDVNQKVVIERSFESTINTRYIKYESLHEDAITDDQWGEKIESFTLLQYGSISIPAIVADSHKLGIYSNDLGNATNYGWDSWGGGTGEDVTIQGKNAYKISAFHYFGSAFPTIDATTYAQLHIDVYPSFTGTLAIIPITGATERGIQFDVIENSWNSKDLSIDDFTDLGLNMENVYQIKYVDHVNASHEPVNGDGTHTFIIGNVYLYGTPIIDTENPTMTNVTVASTNHKSATLTVNATDNNTTGTLTYKVKNSSDEVVATGSATQGENATVVISGLTASTDYEAGVFKVTATDHAGNESAPEDVPAFTTSAAPTGLELTAGGHTILLQGKHYLDRVTNNWELIVSSTDEMSSLGPCYWTLNSGNANMQDNYTKSSDNKTLTICATSTTKPVLYNNFYVNFVTGGEANFGVVNNNDLTWEESGVESLNVIVSGNTASVTGPVTAADVSTIVTNAGSSAILDLTGATLSESVTINPTNRNAIVVVNGTNRTSDKIANLGETKNVIVYDGTYRRAATGYVIALIDDNNSQPAYDFVIDAQQNGVTYTRTVAAGKWVSYNSPASVAIPAGVTVYKATDATTTSVTFTKQESQYLGANVPVILHNNTNDDVVITSNNDKIDLNLTANPGGAAIKETGITQYGTARMIETDGSQYALSNGALHPFNGAKIGAFRVYYTNLSTGSENARAIFVDGETTKIGSINANGEINVEDGVYYNLAGQRVQNPTKGIYIINGKKVVLK